MSDILTLCVVIITLVIVMKNKEILRPITSPISKLWQELKPGFYLSVISLGVYFVLLAFGWVK